MEVLLNSTDFSGEEFGVVGSKVFLNLFLKGKQVINQLVFAGLLVVGGGTVVIGSSSCGGTGSRGRVGTVLVVVL